MRTVVDLTEEATGNDPMALPDPSHITHAADEVVLQLRELEIRMTPEQFVAFYQAISRFHFSPGREYEGRPIGDEDDDYLPAEEHEKLRAVVRALLDGQVGGAEVPDPVRLAVRSEVAQLHPERWRDTADRLLAAEARIRELEADLARKRRRR